MGARNRAPTAHNATLMDIFGGPSDDLRHYRTRGPSCISLSGGRTSGYQLAKILEAHDGVLPTDTHVVFANTGFEHPGTLDFVEQISLRWGVDIVWVEYDGREGARDFREVTHATAARAGEPFETLVGHKNALPNVTSRFCTQVLKVERIRAFMRSRGYESWTDYVGLRADEPRRVAKRRGASDDEVTYAMPLSDAGVTKSDVLRFWRAQPFDLEIPWSAGNCTLCFEKRSGILLEELRRDPASAQRWRLLEERTGRTFTRGRPVRELERIALIPPSQLTGRDRAIAEDLGDDEGRVCACTD